MGNAHGQFHVGAMYWTGDGVRKDEEEATRWWLKAAEAGQISAMIDLAYSYKEGRGNVQNYAEALRWYTAASSHKDAKYQYVPATRPDECSRLPQSGLDVLEGSRCTAERQGGVLLVGKGSGAGQLYGYFSCLTHHQGHAGACNELAVCYRFGRGTAADQAKAFEYYQKAAQLGVAAAQYEVGSCASPFVGNRRA